MPPPTRTADGRTLSSYPEEISFEGGEWIHWGGKEWFNKDKDTTIDEVVGYQLAAAIGIPLVSPNFKLVTGKRLLYHSRARRKCGPWALPSGN
jgi:hypothetical protein